MKKFFCYFAILIAFLMVFNKSPISLLLIISIPLGLYGYTKYRKHRKGKNKNDNLQKIMESFLRQQQIMMQQFIVQGNSYRHNNALLENEENPQNVRFNDDLKEKKDDEKNRIMGALRGY